VILKDAENYGSRMSNLGQDTEMLNIHCDLVNTSLVDEVDTDIIYSFSTSILKPSYSFTMEPRRVTFNPVNKNAISRIRIHITDGKRRQINLNGADTAFSLLLKRITQCIYMKPYEFKRFYHPKLGKFVYNHKGNGLIVHNIFKPIRSIASSVFQNVAEPFAKKAIKSGVQHAGERLGKKAAEKSVDLIMNRLGNMRQKTPAKNATQAESTDMILNRLLSGQGLKHRKGKGLLLEKNSPFNSIPILGRML